MTLTASQEIKMRQHKEWQARKGRRVEKAAQYARHYRTINGTNGRHCVVKVAQRSKGFRSNYEPVNTYFILIYEGEKLINGYTQTENAWRADEAKIDRALANKKQRQ